MAIRSAALPRAGKAAMNDQDKTKDQLLDELRLSGAYERLAERARQKKHVLARHGINGTEGRASGPNPAELRLWFFEQRLGRPLPDDMDAFTRELGFAERADFDSALRREWLYLQVIK